MKALRVLVISFVALLLAMPAMAMNISTSGNIYQWFGAQNMMPSDQGDWDEADEETSFRHHTRARLYFVAEDDEKKVRGTYALEVDIDSGDPDGDLGGDGINVETRRAYIDFELPFDPATRAYMGLQGVGAGSDWVFDDNASGVKVVRSMGNFGAALGWFRYDETNQYVHGDESDLWLLDLNYNFENGNIGAFVYLTDTDGDDVRYYGIDGSMEAGAFSGQFTGIYLDGEDATDTIDYKSYLLHLEGTYSFNNSYVQLGWYYASGDDDAADNDAEGYFALGNNASVTNTWTGSMAFFEALDLEAGGTGIPFIGNFGANVAYLNFGHEFTEKFDGRLGLIWINAAEDVNYGDDKDMGWEVNGEINYAISENLNFGLGAGYVIAGDATDDFQADDGDDLWRVTSAFTLSF